jgi:hypothetical protein
MVTRLSNRLVGHPPAKEYDPVKRTQFRMEQMDRYQICSMWSRPTICSFQLQGCRKRFATPVLIIDLGRSIGFIWTITTSRLSQP